MQSVPLESRLHFIPKVKTFQVTDENPFFSLFLQEFVLSRIFMRDLLTLSRNRLVNFPHVFLKGTELLALWVRVLLILHETESFYCSSFPPPSPYRMRDKTRIQKCAEFCSHTKLCAGEFYTRTKKVTQTRVRLNVQPQGWNPKHPLVSFSLLFLCQLEMCSWDHSFLWKLEGGLNCKSSLSSSWLQWWPPAALYCNAVCHWPAPVSSWSAPLILLWSFAARTQLRAADTLYEGTSHPSLIGNVTPALLFGQDIMFGPHQHVMTSVVSHLVHSQCYSQNKFKVI